MGHRPFNKPVYLKLQSLGNYRAGSAWEALEYLERYWDAPRDAHYGRAQKLCQNAIDGWTTAEKAREAVVEAARRAGVLARGQKSEMGDTHVAYCRTAQEAGASRSGHAAAAQVEPA